MIKVSMYFHPLAVYSYAIQSVSPCTLVSLYIHVQPGHTSLNNLTNGQGDDLRSLLPALTAGDGQRYTVFRKTQSTCDHIH